jgi:hypothetical protein
MCNNNTKKTLFRQMEHREKQQIGAFSKLQLKKRKPKKAPGIRRS